MQLEIIDIEDVYPDENNPRQNMGNLDALAESMSVNPLRPGEPWSPIIVVRDGGIYRIVDGERRYRAMLKNKVTRCQAVVCDGLDDAASALAMVATDDKAQLTEEERSRGVQQTLLLGVDPVVVEKSARLPKGSGKKIKRACEKLGDSAEDLTLDRLFAVADFEAEGDTEAAEAIANYIGNDWQREVKAWQKKREREKELAELVEACKLMGLEQVSDVPDDMSFYTSLIFANEIKYETFPEGCVFVVKHEGYARVSIYEPRCEHAIDTIQKKRAERNAEINNAIEISCAEHRKWFCKAVKEKSDTPNVNALIVDKFIDADAMDAMFAEAGIKLGPSDTIMIGGLVKAQLYKNQSIISEIGLSNAISLDLGNAPRCLFAYARRYMEWLDAHIKDGYIECWTDTLLRRICENALGEATEDGEAL